MNEPDTAAATRANLDPAKAANDLASLLEGRAPTTPLQPRGARLVKPLDSPLDDEPEHQAGTCRDCGAPTGRKNSKVCAECRASKAARRKPRRTDQPQEPGEETAMPRGVYDRSKSKRAKKEDAPPPVAGKRRRRRANGAAEDPKSLAQEALLEAGAHLHATIEELIDYSAFPAVGAAMRSFGLAQKIAKAVG